MLLLQAGLFGTFTALNFFHWFLFWELSLIPAFFLIKFWGGPDRSAAATQFFMYTMVGSVAMLLSFLAIWGATKSFDFLALAKLGASGDLASQLNTTYAGWHWFNIRHASLWIFAGVFLGFAVKVPLVPFHTWLPAAYTEAPTSTTMMLTGLMSKMGVYGFLRVLLPLFPGEMRLVPASVALAGDRHHRAPGVCGICPARLEARFRLFLHQPSRLLPAPESSRWSR